MSAAEQHRPITVKATFVNLLARGLWPVPIKAPGEKMSGGRAAKGKEPVGQGWGLTRWDIDRAHAELSRVAGRGVGLALGPGRGPAREWIIDVEGDGEEAEQSRAVLFDGEVIETCGWSAVRGLHQLFIVDQDRILALLPRLKGLEAKGGEGGVYKSEYLPGLEIRMGGYNAQGAIKQLQSVVPPTPGTDGNPRIWVGPTSIAPAPESFYRTLEQLADLVVRQAKERREAKARASAPVPGPLSPESTDQVARMVEKYCLNALADEAATLAGTPEGGRRFALLAISTNCAGLVRAGALTEFSYRQALSAAARDCHLPEDEAADLIDTALQRSEPRDLTRAREWAVQKVQQYRHQPGAPPEPAKPALRIVNDDPPAPPDGGGPDDAGRDDDPRDFFPPFHLTDLGNAERLVHRHGRDIRYCHTWKRWLVWDAKRWALDETAAIRRLARETVRSIYAEAESRDGDGVRKATAKWGLESEKRDRINAMVSLGESEPTIPILTEEMDLDPWLFNCPNGTIDLRTGTLRPHTRGDSITKLCPVEFHPEAGCPLWLDTLNLFLDRDQEMIDYFQAICGYAMVGVIRDNIMPVAYGKGGNGKSTILGGLLNVFGPDYAMKCAPDMLMAKRNETHPTDRTDLFGKRLVVAIETEENRRLNETLIKELTGNDKIRARRMRENFFEFDPTHTLLLATNHKPVVKNTDDGIWRRLKLLPFEVQVKGRAQDTTMPEKLEAEYPGILAWCVRGCLRWQADGIVEPRKVTEATDEYRAQQDTFGAFLKDCMILGQGLKEKSKDVIARYKNWCEANNENALSGKAFGMALEDRGIKKKSSSGLWYLGLAIKVGDEDEGNGQAGGGDPGGGGDASGWF